MKKLISILLAFLLIFSAGTLAFAGGDGGDMQVVLLAPAVNKDITVICTNDVHCNYLAYDKVATLAKDADLLVDAGDALQGDLIGTLSKGEYIVDIMNYLGYDVAVPGNHDFDFTVQRLVELSKKADFDYVSCNFSKLNGQKTFDAYKIVEIKGKKIAFVGITTPETLASCTPTYFKDASGNFIYTFAEGNNGNDLAKSVQKAVDSAKAAGADFVIALCHLGDHQASHPWTSSDVIQKTTGIDVLVDAHSHNTYIESAKNKDGKPVSFIQTGTKLENCGKITITAAGEIKVENISLADVLPDAETTAYLESITAQFADLQNKIVAKTTVELTTKDSDGNRAVRNHETNLGDLCADAYRIQFGADISVINGGGVRADIAKGDITYGNIISVNPFGNSICLVEVSGQQILDALEFGYSKLPAEHGGFLQVSGLTCTINTAIPSHVVLNDQSEFVKVDGQRRVSDVKINGEPLDVTKKYTLASHDYMLKSKGDGFAMFGTENITLLQDCAQIDNQVLINYIIDDLGGVVGNQYKNARSSLNIIYDESAVEEVSSTYTVVKGDCLWKIAKKVYGDGSMWKVIYNANKSIIQNPNLIYVDQELEIPAA